MRQEHDEATPAGRDLPGDGRRAGRPPAGQQGVRVAQARQELKGGCAQMETTQMQKLVAVRAGFTTTTENRYRNAVNCYNF